ncbi:acyltransferase, partial [bacterium]|nr:acyltransferase [bacterium]
WRAGRGLATRGEIGGATAGTEPGPASRGITAGRAFLVALVAAASFAAGDPAFSPSPSFAYYMLPTRAGGLLVGAMLAFAVAAGVLASPGRAFRETVGWFGAALLLGSFVLLSDREPYPGWRAIPPALGAVLVLLSGQGAPSLVSRALSVGPLVAVGLVSYAAYLWHWPLIAFWIYGFRRVGDAAALGILATTFVLAGASRRWIEGPARRTSASPGRVALVQWVVPGAVVLAVAALAIATGGFGPRALSKRYVDGLAAADLHLRTTLGSESVCQHMRPDAGLLEADRCVTGAPAAPGGVLLWGDSHAGHYVGMLDVIARASGFRFRNFPTSGCPPVLDRPGRFAKWDRRAYCDRSSRQVARDLDRYPVVVLGVAWAAYEAAGGIEAVFETARRLVASGHRVILLGQVQFFPGAWGMWDPDCPRKALSFPGLACSRRVGAPIEPEILRIDERVRDFAQRTPGVSYFDANEESCPDGTCRLYGEDGVALYSDLWHLSMAGSMRLGEAVLRSRGVPPPFDQVPAWLADAARGSSSPPRAVEPGAGEEPEGPGRTRSGPGDSRT